MKKIVITLALILSLIFGLSQISLAKEVDEDLKIKIIDFYKGNEDPESKAYKSWKDGMMKEHLLDLHKVTVAIEFLSQDEREEDIGVSILMTVTGYGMTFDNQKKRVISVRGLIVVINKETRNILGGLQVYRNRNKVTDGWNEPQEI